MSNPLWTTGAIGSLEPSQPVRGDIVFCGVGIKEVIKAVLRKHENASLLTDEGIDEVADDLIGELAVRLHLRDSND
jgi:hypothetical protein